MLFELYNTYNYTKNLIKTGSLSGTISTSFASDIAINRGLETYVKVIDENCPHVFEIQDKTKVGSHSYTKFKLL